jgi:hypothetical protein
MKVRMGFVSNSSSSSFLIAYNPKAYDGDMITRTKKLIKDINNYYKTNNIDYTNPSKDKNYHSNIGKMLFQELDNYHGFRSKQSVIDYLELEDDDSEYDIIEKLAIEYAENGYYLLFGEIPCRGSGGSVLSNQVNEDVKKYSFKSDDLILKIGEY